MKWCDFVPGMTVQVHADDYFDASGDDAGKLKRREEGFTVTGIIMEMTQRTMWVCGCWRWHLQENCTKEDPEYTGGVFGIPRRGPSTIDELTTGRRWIAPLPE